MRDAGARRAGIIKKNLKSLMGTFIGHYFNFLPHREHDLLYTDLSELVSHRKINAVSYENYTKHTYFLNKVHILLKQHVYILANTGL